MVALAGLIALLSIVTVLLFGTDSDDVGANLSREFGKHPTAEDGGIADRDVLAVIAFVPHVLVLVGWTLIFAPMHVVSGHVVRHTSELGIGRSIGVLSIAGIEVSTTVARVGVGPFSDRFGRPRTFVASSPLLGGSTAALVVSPSAGPPPRRGCTVRNRLRRQRRTHRRRYRGPRREQIG
ncbi:MAG: hypothetical protein R6U53_08365 [Natronomonas sp.]